MGEPEVNTLILPTIGKDLISDGNTSVRNGKIKNNGSTSFIIDNMYYLGLRIRE